MCVFFPKKLLLLFFSSKIFLSNFLRIQGQNLPIKKPIHLPMYFKTAFSTWIFQLWFCLRDLNHPWALNPVSCCSHTWNGCKKKISCGSRLPTNFPTGIKWNRILFTIHPSQFKVSLGHFKLAVICVRTIKILIRNLKLTLDGKTGRFETKKITLSFTTHLKSDLKFMVFSNLYEIWWKN